MITDGVTEAHNPEQHLYGMERLLTYCATITDVLGADGAEAICRGLYADVKRFVQTADPSDDITIMAILFAGPIA